MEKSFNVSELSLKAFETGKRFNAKENRRFFILCTFQEKSIEKLKNKLIERALNENN